MRNHRFEALRRATLTLYLMLGVMCFAGCKEEPSDVDPENTPQDTPPPASPDNSPTPEDTIGVIPSPTPVPDTLTSIEILPADITIDTTSTFQYSVGGALRSGAPTAVTVETWVSSNPEVALVDTAGSVTALAPGETLIHAESEGVFSNTVRLEIVAPGVLHVRVVDADTRLPLPLTKVYRGTDGLESHSTDEEGKLTVEGDFSGPQTLTATAPQYHLATVQDAVSRNIVIPVRSYAATWEGSFSGQTDFSAMGDLSFNKIRVGIITRSFFGNPLSLDTLTIIGNNRYVTICGFEDVPIPSNVVGQTACGDSAEDLLTMGKFSVPGTAGTYDSYMIAGDIAANTVLGWLGDEDIFSNLGLLLYGIPDIYDFSYEFVEDISVAPAEDTASYAAPEGAANKPMTIQIPTLPSGMDPYYLPVLFAIADMGDRGLLPVGLNGGEAGTRGTVFYPPEFSNRPLSGVVMAGQQGVGSTGPYVVVMGDLVSEDETVKTPPFMDLVLPDATVSDYDTRVFAHYPTPSTTVYRSTMSWYTSLDTPDGDPETTTNQYIYWDVYLPATSLVTVLPDIPEAPAFNDRFNWEILAYDNGTWSFEYFTSDPDLNIYDAATQLFRISRNYLDNAILYM